MLARTLFKVYEIPAVRNKVYADKLPGIISRLKAGELIARNIGLIRSSFFSFSSGHIINEYRKNLVVMKLLSHALSRLEFAGWVKVYPDRIYYIDKKDILLTGQAEKHRIFDVIMEVASEVAQTIDKKFDVKRSLRILEGCKITPGHQLPKDIRSEVRSLRDLFVEVKSLEEADGLESERKPGILQRLDLSPITKGAAKDIAASAHFAKKNRKVFNRSAASNVAAQDRKTLVAKKLEANKFDQRLKTEMQKAKELSAAKLREEFSMEEVEHLALFQGQIADTSKNIEALFSPSENDMFSYFRLFTDSMAARYKPDAVLGFLRSVFLPTVRQQLEGAFKKIDESGLSRETKMELIVSAKAWIPEILMELLNSEFEGVFAEHQSATDFRARIAEISRKYFSDDFVERALEKERALASELLEYETAFVISDLHLQDFPHRDTFELLRLIHVVRRCGGTLIINGDFMDTWRARNVESIIKNNKIVFDALSRLNRVIIVKGNHDSWMDGIVGQKLFSDNVSLVDYFWDADVHIEHGHASDRFNKEDSDVGKAATRFINIFEKNETLGPQLLSWTEYVGKRLMSDKAWLDQKSDRVISGIKKALRKRDPLGKIYSTQRPLNVIFGHYHFPAGFKVYEEIIERVKNDKEIGGRVRFLLTDSWCNSEGYAGEVIAIARKKAEGTGQLLISTFLWEYIGAKEILTLYENWKF